MPICADCIPRTHKRATHPSTLAPQPTQACRLLSQYERAAVKAGVPPHARLSWVRRKLGGAVAIWRRTADGALACAAPCLFCARQLRAYGLTVHCTVDGGAWFSGRLDEPEAPAPKLTGGQKRVLRAQGWRHCDDDGASEGAAGGGDGQSAPAEQQRPQQRRGRRRGRRA